MPGLAQWDRIPVTTASICSFVSIPPELRANAGIAVPGTPLAVTREIVASSAIARYRGSPSPIAAAPLPSAPWHPAQFILYRRLKSEILLGGITTKSGAGRPGGLFRVQAVTMKANAEKSTAGRFITFDPPRSCL